MEKYSPKFWIFFWLLSFIFLTGWFLFWEIKARGAASIIENAIEILPINESEKKDYQAMSALGDFFIRNRNNEITLMVLFQNNMEIRPGGGFIGAFGIVKIKNGKVLSMETHDLSNFDNQIPNTIIPPYPLAETKVAKFWKLRDSNFSPDFATNAKKAEEFYHLGQGREEIDGVVGITSDVLVSMLKITGPISIEGYPGTYNSENAVLSLEYQVEQAFEQQGIDQAERKLVMLDLAKEIEKRIFSFSLIQKIKLAKVLLVDLNHKDIQMYFKDATLQEKIAEAQWSGAIDEQWGSDYLMTSDANLGSFKSDYYVRRSVDYTVDLSKDVPTATLKISYEHTAKQKDWMTRDYTNYLRVYVPKNAEFVSQQNFNDTRFGNEFGKQYFGAIIKVPIGTSKTIEIKYALPLSVKEDYALKIQKQAGLNGASFDFHIINQDGNREDSFHLMNSDMVLR